MSKEYYIVSLKHTSKGDTALTLWRKNGAGYCWEKDWAGVYQEEDRLKHETHENVFVDKVIADSMFLPANDWGDKFTALPNDTSVLVRLGLSQKFMKEKKYATCRMKFVNSDKQPQ